MPTAQQTAEALALVQAQSAAREQLSAATQAAVAAEVAAFSGWYDPQAVTTWAGRLAKLVRSAQKQVAASTDAFSVRALRLLTGRSVRAVGPVDVSRARGVSLERVYGRLADQYRYLDQTRGENVPAARLERPGKPPLERIDREARVARLLIRGEVVTDDNLLLAFQEQWAADLAEAADDVIGYRRVIHPELAKSGLSCGLCVVASDRQYAREDLLPLHSRCNCGVLPIIGDESGEVRFDPGLEINREDLKTAYANAGSTDAEALKRTRFRVVQHAELGPRLVYAGQHHRTAAEVNEDASRDLSRAVSRRARTSEDVEQVLAAAEKAISELLARQARGDDVSGQLAFQRRLASRMKGKLRAS